MRPRFILFLDFDGVIKHKRLKRLERQCVNRVNDLARRVDAQVVISSSWRVVLSLAKLDRVFEGRVAGSTPSLESLDATVAHARYEEIRSFLKEHGWQDVPWIALDDEAHHYPAAAPVHLTDPEVLLSDDDVEAIVSRCQDR